MVTHPGRRTGVEITARGVVAGERRRRRARLATVTLGLAGTCAAAFVVSLSLGEVDISFCMTSADVYDARDALVWLTGSLNATTWATVQVLGLGTAVLVPLTLFAGRWLTALQAGDDVARALGVPVERARLGLIVLAVGLAAVATGAVGPVAFVAFVSGPIARRLAGNHGIALVPSALVGALVLTASDVVAQHAFESVEFPVGVVTAIVGAPYLLCLLAITDRVGRSG